MGEPAEITVVFGDGAVPGTRTFVKPFSQIDARAKGLAAGASPTASISGSDTTPILSLGIPKGDKGDTGPTGPRGPQGVKGDKGEPGGSEDAIAAYFRRAASRPMQALAELGVPRPYASKMAIDATRGSFVGELARDVSSRVTYVWNGSRWRKWDTPSWADASITRGSYIDSISCRYKFTNGICQVMGLVSPSQGVSGDWQFATINDTDLRSSLGIIPAAMRGSVVINGYLNTESGQLWLTSPGGLWGAYFSITYPVDLNK